MLHTSLKTSKDDVSMKAFVSKVMWRGFLPVQIVRQNIGLISTRRQLQHLVIQYPDLNPIIAYVDNTCIKGRFLPAMWNYRKEKTKERDKQELTTTQKVIISIKTLLSFTNTYRLTPFQ